MAWKLQIFVLPDLKELMLSHQEEEWQQSLTARIKIYLNLPHEIMEIHIVLKPNNNYTEVCIATRFFTVVHEVSNFLNIRVFRAIVFTPVSNHVFLTPPHFIATAEPRQMHQLASCTGIMGGFFHSSLVLNNTHKSLIKLLYCESHSHHWYFPLTLYSPHFLSV